MIALPFLEYNLSHPHPKGHWFLIATIIIFLAITPVLVLVNFATLGFELVPELQTEWRNINEPLDAWWGTRRLPLLLRPRTPRCEPKDIGRGDTFRLTGSLFDYTVMSSWNKTDHTDTGVQQQARVVYTGQSFADCYVTNARYDYSMGDQAHSVTIGVFCPGYDDYRVEMTMQTTVTFARELTKDFIGQYYGGGLDLMNIAESTDYRKTVLAVMEVIATDALSILRKPNLPIPLLSMRLFFRDITAEEAILSDTPETSNVVYVNGTQPEEAPEEVFIYINSVFNLVYVVMDAVNLDLGNIKPPNMFRNKTRFPEVVFSNKAPTDPPINNITNWAKGGATSFYYGRIPDQYQTWAETLLAGQPENITLTDTTGPPRSVMATTYLCPRYQLKPTNALLTSVFVGAATMTLSVWGAWMFFTAFLARRIMAPQVICYCDDCKARRLREAIRTEGIRQRRAAMRESNSIIARFMAFMGIDGRRERTVYPPESDLEDQEYPAVPHSGRPMLAEASDNKKVSYLSGSPTGEK